MRGYIVQRNKKKKDHLSVVIAYKDTITNKSKRKWYTVIGTKKDAEIFMTEKLRELDTGIFANDKNMTLAEYLKYWYEQICVPNLSPTTYESYEKNIRVHISPALGNIKLSKLAPIHLQTFYSNLLESGLSKTTIRYIHRIIHSALEQAVKWQLVVRNVAGNTSPPKPDKYTANILNSTEISTLLNVSKASDIYIPIVIAIYTGMRRGEIVALTWDNVNLDKKYIRVCKALYKTKQGLIYKSPKTQKSNRFIPISDTLVNILKDLKKQQEILKELNGDTYIDKNLVCCTENGNEIDPDCLCPKFKRILRKNNLPIIRFHDLRHTHASLLLKEGKQAKAISDRLGHSTISTTLNIYAHVYEETSRDLAESFDELISTSG